MNLLHQSRGHWRTGCREDQGSGYLPSLHSPGPTACCHLALLLLPQSVNLLFFPEKESGKEGGKLEVGGGRQREGAARGSVSLGTELRCFPFGALKTEVCCMGFSTVRLRGDGGRHRLPRFSARRPGGHVPGQQFLLLPPPWPFGQFCPADTI